MRLTQLTGAGRVLTLAGMALGLGASAALAADYPQKPVELVIPFSQGGGTDQVGRIFAQYAEPYLGTEIFVSNRTGGSGAVGFAYGAAAKPDGHVITMVVTTLAAAPHTIEQYPVSHEDFAPVCLLTAPPATLAVHPDSGIDSLEDLIAKAKAQPGKITIGTAGPGSNTHLIAASLADQAGIEVRYVPNKGSGPALTSTYGKHIDVAVADKAEVAPWIADGRLKVITVFTDDPANGIEGVKLATESGFNIDIGSFRAIGAPKGTPEPVLEVLVETCRKTSEDPKFVEHITKTGTEPYVLLGDKFGTWLANKHKAFGDAVKAAGL